MLYGGRSGEHEVSLASAAAVFANLDRTRYEPVPIRIEKSGQWALADRAPTAASAADAIEQARLDAARPSRGGREVHLVARPSAETILSIDRRLKTRDEEEHAVVTGLNLDVIFPVLHGPYGEDGTIQGLLELANVPYVGAGVLASAVGMDKAQMKLAFAAKGLPICDYEVVLKRDWRRDERAILETLVARLGFPLFVKPANLGSSVGISKAKHAAELRTAIALAAEFDRKIVVEAAVPHAREIEVAVLGNDDPEASVPGEIIVTHADGFYSYAAKYLDPNGASWQIPADIPADTAALVRRLSVEAFKALELAGMARVDFFVGRRSGTVFLNEANTIPGFTTISMYPKMWEASGLSYSSLLDRLIALALERHAEKQRLRTSLM